MAKRVHVVPHLEGWAVKREGNERATSVHDRQRDAQEAAIPIAKRDHTEVVTHGRDGKIRDSDSYGPDPNPPRSRLLPLRQNSRIATSCKRSGNSRP